MEVTVNIQNTKMSKQFAVFDIDGTLIRWQLYHAVVNSLAKEGLLGETAYSDIREARMIWKRRAHPDAFKEYERRLIGIYDQAVSGLSVDQLQQAADRVLEEYRDQTYVYTRDLITELKKRGYTLLAISGSTKELVEKLTEYYGFDDFIASEYEQANGKFTGQKMVASEDKAQALETLVQKHGLDHGGSIAVGDTQSDIALLENVELPIAFNPDRYLYATARANGWRIVVERKNVIYELGPQNGTYILV